MCLLSNRRRHLNYRPCTGHGLGACKPCAFVYKDQGLLPQGSKITHTTVCLCAELASRISSVKVVVVTVSVDDVVGLHRAMRQKQFHVSRLAIRIPVWCGHLCGFSRSCLKHIESEPCNFNPGIPAPHADHQEARAFDWQSCISKDDFFRALCIMTNIN